MSEKMGTILKSFPYKIRQDDGGQNVGAQNEGQSNNPEYFDQHGHIEKDVSVERDKHEDGQSLKRRGSHAENQHRQTEGVFLVTSTIAIIPLILVFSLNTNS